jgi:hypothetical protein
LVALSLSLSSVFVCVCLGCKWFAVPGFLGKSDTEQKY